MHYRKDISVSPDLSKKKNYKYTALITWKLPPYNPKQDDIQLFYELYNPNTTSDRQDQIYAQITENNMRLVSFIIFKGFGNIQDMCCNYRCTADDFYSAGVYGLLKAIHSFNYESGIKLASYASRCIYNELGMFIRKQRRSNVSKGKVTTSIHKPLSIDDQGNQITLADLLSIEDDSEIFANKEFAWKVWEELERRLKKNQIKVFRAYLIGETSQIDIANEMGISQSYVSRLIMQAINKAKEVYDRKIV